ncbi:RraA family protein [Sinomonas humi]|uniref:Putative 4-hydroxy-4-methyl-2-oxoglutarate aldolase n=1 Tax=Sinomonas humi TaxID=1338436 RepID=A0A0B2AI47_9MICC|nr:diguanylate cyclase [Sinomonas humi]KHL01501.1 diguanylate cyclase [Sinomonas humi]
MTYITEERTALSEDALIERLKALPTAAVSDALDALGIAGQLLGVAPRTATGTAAGRAFTVRYEPVDEHGGTVGDFLDEVPAGHVVVIENAARTDCTVWGGIMSRVAAARGVAGTVVYGACRDLAASEQAGYALWSSAVFMRTGKDRVRCAEVQGRVQIAGVAVAPSDYVLADADGVLVIPANRVEEVLALAEEIERTETAIAEAAIEGGSLVAARTSFGYHALQSARDSR